MEIEKETRLSRVQRRIIEKETILDLTKDHFKTIELLQSKNLLCTVLVRSTCNHEMSLITNNAKADLLMFRCKTCGCARSLRSGIIFENSKLSLIEQTRIMLYYFLNSSSIQEVHEDTGIARDTIGRIYIKLRSLVSTYIQQTCIDNPLGKIIRFRISLQE